MVVKFKNGTQYQFLYMEIGNLGKEYSTKSQRYSGMQEQLSELDGSYRGTRIFHMSEHELAFVERVLTRKPNLQIYRTHKTVQMGDFVIIDLSGVDL